MSGIAGFVVGLALGLAVAVGVYLFDRRPAARLAQESPPMTRDEAPAPAKPAAGVGIAGRGDAVRVLRNAAEVRSRHPGAGRHAAPAAGPGAGPVQKPGAYILQAGSFRNHADADRVRALIAMQGVESKIQKVTIDRDTWHRVRVGPITNLQQLEDTRSKLRNARIDALVIRVGE